MTMPRTLFDKIWAQHVVAELPGGVSLLHVDRHLLHDLEAGPGFTHLARRGHTVHSPSLAFAMPDHAVSTAPDRTTDTNPRGGELLREMRRGAHAAGVRMFDIGHESQGILHVAAPDLGLTLPGMVLVCPDSHTCTHGGLGALAFGIGASEVAHVLATQTLRQKKPKAMRINFEGQRRQGVSAKDVILATIGQVGTAAGRGHAVEYAGAFIHGLSVDERLTVCNLSIELGAKIGMIAPDDITYAYLAGRDHAPKGALFDKAVAHWRTLPSEDGAAFDIEHTVRVDAVAPQVTWGTSPQDVIAIDGIVPDPSREADAKKRQRMETALTYMGLTPGQTIEGTPVDWVFIGSCTNGRLSDLRDAAKLLDGRKVAATVRAWAVPGSEAVKRAAEREGLDRIFTAAGFEWRAPGCSMCVGANGDMVGPGQRSVSTTNRNFVGRQGRDARTHLGSPVTAVAAAVTGTIADARKLVA